jgi:hypothetical protein
MYMQHISEYRACHPPAMMLVILFQADGCQWLVRQDVESPHCHLSS